MNPTDLSNDLAFSDPRLLLQPTLQPTSNNSTYESENDFNAASGISFFLVQIIVVFCGCVCMYLSCRNSRLDATVPPQRAQKQRKRSTSTLAQRKQAILEQFETSQVSMVSNEDTWMPARHENKKFTQEETSPNFNPFRK
jgi:heme/copper-type cytochrome/quinol oxidase subunit 3